MASSARHQPIVLHLLSLLGIMFLSMLIGKWSIDHLLTAIKPAYYLLGKYELSYRGFLLLSQTIISISFFIVAPLLYGYFIERKKIRMFFVGEKRYGQFIVWTILLMLAAMEVSKYVVYWNMHLKLPGFLEVFELWAQQKEAALQETLDVLMAFDDIPNLLLIIFALGVIPALGEELLFRGVLQPIFFRGTQHRHVAIWVSAFLFSAIHMQVYGFFPRLLFGVLFGYLYAWTRNLWYPIIAHLFNNAFALVYHFLYGKHITLTEKYELPSMYMLGGAVLVVIVVGILVILGAGESGTGAALLAQAKGYRVFVSDRQAIAPFYKQQLLDYAIDFEEGNHTWDKIKEADEVIKSPGIPNQAPIIQTLQAAYIPIIDEIAFATRYTSAKLIGITGSNGKSTTTHLTYHLLKAGGLNVGIAGNMGDSFAKKVWLETHDYYVLEVSNFQLEYMHHLQMAVGCLLNITPDHLDRYNYQFAGYAAAKLNILCNIHPEGRLVYNHDDATIRNYLISNPKKIQHYPVSLKPMPDELDGAYIKEDHLYVKQHAMQVTIPLEGLPLIGPHNQYNMLAAVAIASYLGVGVTDMIAGLCSFQGLPHRLEWVGQVNQVDFYNDSKATNVESAEVALESFTKPMIWIAGGYDKGNDYTVLKELVAKKVKGILLLGKDTTLMEKAFEDLPIPIKTTDTMQEAVAHAYGMAKPGDVVLLSPACASFDLFKNFEERGNQFKAVVQQLCTTPIPSI
eukprot:gene3042-3804_t